MRKRTAFFVGAAGMRIATASVRTGCGNDRVTQEVRWGGQAEASAPTEGLQKAWLVVACRIRIHTHIHYIHPQKPRRVCRPQTAKNFKSFFTATCAWGKIPLRLPVWNFVACDKIMRAADCKPLWQKIP